MSMCFLYTAAVIYSLILSSTRITSRGAVEAFVQPLQISKLRCHNLQCIEYHRNRRRRGRRTFMVHGNFDTKRNVHNPKHGKSNKKTNKKRITKKKFKKGNNSKHLMQAKAINKELIDSSSASEVLDIFISKGGAKGVAGGGAFNSVNYSTFMHRLARFATYVDYTKQRNGNEPTADEKRKRILSDPRTAILIASLAEAMARPDSKKGLVFNNRELANLGWALSKLKFAPPSNIYPISRPKIAEIDSINSKSDKNIVFVSPETMEDDMLQAATKIRQQVLEVAKERSMSTRGTVVKSKWIPNMSQLCGKLLDSIAAKVLGILDKFNSQELANLLYAFASADRADEYLFDRLATQHVQNVRGSSYQKNSRKVQPKPQEFR